MTPLLRPAAEAAQFLGPAAGVVLELRLAHLLRDVEGGEAALDHGHGDALAGVGDEELDQGGVAGRQVGPGSLAGPAEGRVALRPHLHHLLRCIQ
jgi:hypothetical protein